MTIRRTNHPIIRDLQEIGLLSTDAAPKIEGPFQTFTEAFAGDASGATKTLAQTVTDVVSVMTIPIAAGTNNTLTMLTEDTHFTLSAAVLTWITDQSANNVLITYCF